MIKNVTRKYKSFGIFKKKLKCAKLTFESLQKIYSIDEICL